MVHDPRHNSRAITEGPDRAPARSMLKAIGFTSEDLRRPIIGVANTWTETMPCNYHLRRLAERVKEGIRAAGATPSVSRMRLLRGFATGDLPSARLLDGRDRPPHARVRQRGGGERPHTRQTRRTPPQARPTGA